jgi:hypothetical protein
MGARPADRMPTDNEQYRSHEHSPFMPGQGPFDGLVTNQPSGFLSDWRAAGGVWIHWSAGQLGRVSRAQHADMQ